MVLNRRIDSSWLVVIALGILWEVVEPYTAEVWFNFREPWYNRWISDILIDIAGALVGRKICQMEKEQTHK